MRATEHEIMSVTGHPRRRSHATRKPRDKKSWLNGRWRSWAPAKRGTKVSHFALVSDAVGQKILL